MRAVLAVTVTDIATIVGVILAVAVAICGGLWKLGSSVGKVYKSITEQLAQQTEHLHQQDIRLVKIEEQVKPNGLARRAGTADMTTRDVLDELRDNIAVLNDNYKDVKVELQAIKDKK